MSIYSVIWNQAKDTYTRADITNQAPTIQVDTPNNATLYEGSTLTLTGFAKDKDMGDVVTVRYRVGEGTVRPITTAISNGDNSVPFEKVLAFRGGKLYDGAMLLLDNAAQGTAYVAQVWAEDDKGGKSDVINVTFFAVPNRPPQLTINALVDKSGLVDSDALTVAGNVVDPDGNAVTVEYAVNGGQFVQAFGNGEASSGDFTFDVALDKLVTGANAIQVRAKDTYGFTTSRTISLTKRHDAVPLKTSVARYIITPPTGSAKEVLTWIQRKIGDLGVSAEVSLTTDLNEPENYVLMPLGIDGAPVDVGTVEDEFTLATETPKERIILKVNLTADSANTDAAVTLLSGVLA